MTNACWFKSRRIGYGATPNTWERWAVTAAYCLWACVAAIATHQSSDQVIVGLVSVIVAATIALVVIGNKKSDGQWGWNAWAKQISGKNDDGIA